MLEFYSLSSENSPAKFFIKMVCSSFLYFCRSHSCHHFNRKPSVGINKLSFHRRLYTYMKYKTRYPSPPSSYLFLKLIFYKAVPTLKGVKNELRQSHFLMFVNVSFCHLNGFDNKWSWMLFFISIILFFSFFWEDFQENFPYVYIFNGFYPVSLLFSLCSSRNSFLTVFS